jgi:hypothetical protein
MMTNAANAITGHTESKPGLFARILRAHLWLSTWAERNVPAGEDGKHIPDRVRRIIETRNFFI